MFDRFRASRHAKKLRQRVSHSLDAETKLCQTRQVDGDLSILNRSLTAVQALGREV
jgi:hypothetical protein